MVGEIATAYVQLEARGGAALSSSVNRAMPTSTLSSAGQQGGVAYADGVGDGVGKSKGRLSGALGGALKLGAVGAAAGAAVGLSFAKGAFDAYSESQKIAALTANAIEATGGAANVTAKEVGDLSAAMAAKTGIDDEVIQTGANMILTFKNIRNEAGKNNKIFDEATAAAVDLSAAGFGSVEGASVMLGKALNDPIKGISAMSRAGVTFTEDQKKMITAMVEGGDVLGAQKIILEEISGQVGGAAEAQATAADKMKVAWGNFEEEVGGKVAPVFTKIVEGATEGIGMLSGLLSGEGIPGMGGGDGPLANGLENISEVTGHVLDAGKEVWEGLKAGWGELTESVGKILEEHGPMIEQIQDVMGKVASEAMDVLGPALKWVAEEGLNALGEGFEFMFDSIKAGGNVFFGFSQMTLDMAGSVVETVTDMAANVIGGFAAIAAAGEALGIPEMSGVAADLVELRDRVEGFGDDFKVVSDNMKANLAEQQWAWNLTTEEAEELGNRIRMLPDRVETYVRTPGVIQTMEQIREIQTVFELTPDEVVTLVQASGVEMTLRQIKKLNKEADLTPREIALMVRQSGGVETVGDVRKVLKIADATDKKEVGIVLRALGIDASVADFKRAKDAATDVDKLRPKPKLGVDHGDFFGIFGRAAQEIRDLDGDTAHTYVVTHRVGGNAGDSEIVSPGGSKRALTLPTVEERTSTTSSRGGGSMRLVEGRLSIDESGIAYIQGLARDEIDDAADFHGTLVRMGG